MNFRKLFYIFLFLNIFYSNESFAQQKKVFEFEIKMTADGGYSLKSCLPFAQYHPRLILPASAIITKTDTYQSGPMLAVYNSKWVNDCLVAVVEEQQTEQEIKEFIMEFTILSLEQIKLNIINN